MPFKAGKSPKDVSRKYKAVVNDMAGRKVKTALTKVVVYAAGASKEIAPVEFGSLVNSQFREVNKTDFGWRGTVGYTQSYAAALESPRPGGRLDGWKPKPPEEKFGPAWNPIATQGFLRLGFLGQESRPAIERILKREITLK